MTDQAEVDELIAKGFKQYGRDPYLGGLLFQDTRGDGYSLGPDGKIDGNDAYNLLSENGTPRINYGFGGSFSWKGITIDMHFQGVGSYDRRLVVMQLKVFRNMAETLVLIIQFGLVINVGVLKIQMVFIPG